MRDFLCHATTFARIADRLKPFAADIAPLIIDDESILSRPWGGNVPETPGTTIVYGTQDIYFSRAARKFFQLALAAPQLDWVQSSAAGIENPVLRSLGQKAGVYTSSHAQSPAIAEWVIWAALDHFQGGKERRAAQSAKQWKRMNFREISDTRWLVIGFGAIGRDAACRLRALGAHVTGCRRSAEQDADADAMILPGQVGDVLNTVDGVLLSLPLTTETEKLADAEFFAAMKPGALFLNVGRGGLVDEPALLAGLDAGQPGAATLDVASVEPLPAESPIWTHPAIMLTPHISALTQAAMIRTDTIMLDNLERFLSGKPMRNHVEKRELS